MFEETNANGRLSLSARYNTDLFEEKTVSETLCDIDRTLRHVVEDPDRRLSDSRSSRRSCLPTQADQRAVPGARAIRGSGCWISYRKSQSSLRDYLRRFTRPADQILVATARVHDCALLTLDHKIHSYADAKLVPLAPPNSPHSP